jgi:WD40 repeat protein
MCLHSLHVAMFMHKLVFSHKLQGCDGGRLADYQHGVRKRTRLMHSSSTSDVERMRACLGVGSRVDSADASGRTALLYALASRSTDAEAVLRAAGGALQPFAGVRERLLPGVYRENGATFVTVLPNGDILSSDSIVLRKYAAPGFLVQEVRLTDIGINSAAESIAYAAHWRGDTIALASLSGALFLLNVRTMQQARVLGPVLAAEGGFCLCSLAVSDGGDLLFSSNYHDCLWILSLAEDGLVLRRCIDAIARPLTFAVQNAQIVFGSWNTNLIRGFDLATNALVAGMSFLCPQNVESDQLLSLVPLKDLRLAGIYGHHSTNVYVWSATGGRPVVTLRQPLMYYDPGVDPSNNNPFWTRATAELPDGRVVVLYRSGEVWAFDLSSRSVTRIVPSNRSNGGADVIVALPSGKLAVPDGGGGRGMISIWS